MKIFVDFKKNVKKLTLRNGIDYFVLYERSDGQNFLNKLKFNKTLSKSDLINFVKDQDSFFRFAIWNKNFFFGAVDQVASKTILYKKQINKLNIYLDTPNIDQYNRTAAIDILNSGYTLNNETVFENVKSLLPGEYIYFDKKKNDNIILNWYCFDPEYRDKNINDIDLNLILIKIFEKIKIVNSKKKFLIPLSAGFDSRLVVSLMKSLGAKIETFTYGFENQRDFKIAGEICAELGIKNHKIVMNKYNSRVYKKFFFKNFLQYKNFGVAANNFGDFGPLSILNNKINTNEFMILNGQSGDFLTGGHLPINLISIKNSLNKNKTLLFNYIIQKHYSLWGNYNEDVKQDYLKRLNKYYFKNCKNYYDLLRSYEIYEFENRQSKWVIGQQKVYEFFGYSWELPLWKTSLMKYFEKKVGLKNKINQKYYKSFLIKKNYSNVWKNILINPNLTFPLVISLLRRFLKIIFIFQKREKWHLFHKKYFEYFLDPTGVMRLLKYRDYINLISTPRNSISIISKKYFDKFKL